MNVYIFRINHILLLQVGKYFYCIVGYFRKGEDSTDNVDSYQNRSTQ